ncbi:MULTISPECIES: glycosyltransferase [unclassified Acidisoma]|jgi:colanic acid/amylovoran biosynthesis glycosyltransferase|uniref:glycosyltransferase n=1 Tax=unclassified Acidisoma TaxID=2634065 RepID=UPI00131C9FDD|nr:MULTISPECIES: glycosyltransferase [unclassified Acidisoma]
MSRSVLVYRDVILPASETGFMRRQYCGFTRLHPIWIGRRLTEFSSGLDARRLGGEGPLGGLRRLAFKEAGLVPDLAALEALKPMALHAQFGRGGALALPIVQALGIPLVVTFHGGDAHKNTHYRRFPPGVFARRLPRLIAQTRLFVCVSESVRVRLIERGFPREKLVLLPVGTEIPEPQPEEPRDGVLFVGRFVEKKGLGTLIAALHLLRAKGQEPAAVIVGDGPEAAVRRREAEGLARLSFVGWQPSEEVARLMRRARVLVAPSLRASGGDAEGLPSVAVEAMALGLPVLASDEAGVEGVVRPGETGEIVPARDPAALAEAIAHLLAEPHTLAVLGTAARRFVVQHLDARRQSAALEETLLSLA